MAELLVTGLDWAADHIRATLEEPLGAQCVTTFASVLDYGLGNGTLPFAELEAMQHDEIMPADVGLGLISGVIGLIRDKMEGEAPNPNVDRIVAGLERAVDAAIAGRA
jgi:hypothetical protein